MNPMMSDQERALWLWLESLSHRQEDNLCCVCGSQLTGDSSARCWRCVSKGLQPRPKPVWLCTMFCCPTCGQPCELGAASCVCCQQPVRWEIPIGELLRVAGVDLPSQSFGDLAERLRAGQLEREVPAVPVAYISVGADEDGKLQA